VCTRGAGAPASGVYNIIADRDEVGQRTEFHLTRDIAAVRFNGVARRPGLGVDINETLAAQYPYQRAYLPVNRLEHGTMTNW
jgi:hypothetical protein